MMRPMGLALLVFGIFVTLRPAYGNPNSTLIELSPDLLSGDSLGESTLGFSYSVEYSRSNLADISIGEAESLLHLKFNGTVALDKSLNNRALISEVLVGFSLLTGQASTDPFTAGQDPDADFEQARNVGNWGYLYSGLNARHETVQDFDEQKIAAGLEVGYINPNDVGLFSFIPSVILACEYVEAIESDIAADLNADDDFSRLRLEASLKSSFGRQLFRSPALQPLGLRLDLRYFRAFNLDDELEKANQDEITYFAAVLTYTLEQRIAGLENQIFFIGFSDGRIPPNTEDETIVLLGVTLPLGK
jgi:hypothetical protein